MPNKPGHLVSIDKPDRLNDFVYGTPPYRNPDPLDRDQRLLAKALFNKMTGGTDAGVAPARRAMAESARREFRQSEDAGSGPYMRGAKLYQDGEGGE